MKIMILTAATGGGHLRAAHALEEYIKGHTSHDVLTVDALKAVGKLLDRTVCDSYLFMAKKTPALFGKLYKRTNRQSRFSSLVPKLNGKFASLLLKAVQEYGPDAIVTTHPFAAEMAASLKESGLIGASLVSVITDYGPHRAYTAPGVDAYSVACDDMVAATCGLGVPREKIHPFGIPVHEAFFQPEETPEERSQARRALGLDPDLPTLLFMAGSFGVSNIIKLFRSLSETKVPMQLIVITGRNKKLYAAFEEELRQQPHPPTKLVFFTNEVENYMRLSDLLITKPGGLTVSEALACNLPLAVFDAIPGQEEDNAAFLSAHGMGVHLRKEEDFAGTVSSLLADKERLASMRRCCEGFDKSRACAQLVGLLEKLDAKRKEPEPARV